MSDTWDERTRHLIGDDAARRVASARVLVVGVGGVGGYAAEMLARTGVGHLTLVDSDCVAESNINRQLIATSGTVGLPKVDLFMSRFAGINPGIEVEPRMEYVSPDNVEDLLAPGYDFVVDAIDTVAPKVALISHCLRRGIRIISSMGAGGRLHPEKAGYFDLWETREDGLARAVRQRLRQQGLRRPLRVVASTEAPRRSAVIELDSPNKRSSYGTVAAVPATFGILMASHVINKLIENA